uniref:GAG-pre-integrase domain-containing protein n=1 Tax=Lactuca sativa TaxID=4236 RepID=A0A9R1UIR2_LACSA|nr:hypothetical protein LSAT_V11C900456030 [Lactuca sativa]
MEEARKANQISPNTSFLVVARPTTTTTGKHPTTTALHTATGYSPSQQPAPDSQHNHQHGRGYSESTPRGRGRGSHGRGRGHGRGRSGNFHGHHFYLQQWNSNPYQNWQQWSPPPCPYPTAPPSRPLRPGTPGSGILGAPPTHAYAASEKYYTPTNFEQALHTMTLNPDQNWYLDTGATNHMTHSIGTLSSYINNSIPNHIVIGNGFKIPINGTGHTTLSPPLPPLKINNALVAPHLIKNLLSVRRLTTDNHIAIEFDPFGFLVKDLQTKITILRCDSTGDLYLLSLPTARTIPSTFAALSQDLWHQRLGHPGVSLLHILNKHKSISVSKFSDSKICQTCVFGKHIKLPFNDSLSTTMLPFDIIHKFFVDISYYK